VALGLRAGGGPLDCTGLHEISLEQLGKMRERRQKLTPRRGRPGRKNIAGAAMLLILASCSWPQSPRHDQTEPRRQFFATLAERDRRIQRLDRDIAAGRRVAASSGLFSLVLPAGWVMRTGEDVAPYTSRSSARTGSASA